MVRMILETKPCSAEENMRLDAELLKNLGNQEEPILHLYEWEKGSITFGYFAKPEKLLDMKEVKKRGIDLARRPTGGGVVFHLWDLAFSILVPAKSPLFSENTLENYNLVNRLVKTVVEEVISGEMHLSPEDAPVKDENCSFFCMARPTKYDVIFQGRKIAGAAQRKTKDGFLHQGTIALQVPDVDLLQAVLPSETVREAIFQTTLPLFSNLEKGRLELRELLKKHFVRL